MPDSKERSKVRVEAVDTSCGSTRHMTADEIKGRSIGDEVNLACPECGEIHLTPEDACEAAAKKTSASPKYHKIKAEAELDKKWPARPPLFTVPGTFHIIVAANPRLP